ncbi:YafY family protein [Paenibacillus sp. J2TS4]|uniref:helix-turn-helix transcriptional regulator n=1 Tax=Paenibacillus sp. J2TS4 TaxID=2807194 RepID=UPI001B0079C1|nr:YafY family protein [Paenibacillus sp. J2TS4]GIP33571.1 DeoR family transcriptional regulator [Paenibacillus sp. J2TS4]
MKLDRLLSITMALLSNNRVSAVELADRFEVSLRTIYRDMETLNQAGIPITSYPGPDGGYEIMSGYRLDKQVLTLEQFHSIYTALRGIQSATDNSDMTDLLERIGALIPDGSGAPSSFSLDFRHASDKDVKEKIRSLDLAVRKMHVVEFDYMDNQGVETSRTLEPMGLYLKRSAWYLWGFCRIRSALRVFRLSRMNDLNVLSEMFIRRDLTVEDVDKDRRWIKPPDGVDVTLLFQPLAKARVRDEFEASRIVTNPDGTQQVTAYYYTKEKAIQHIISFGIHVKVLGPPEMVKALYSHVLQISHLYEE